MTEKEKDELRPLLEEIGRWATPEALRALLEAIGHPKTAMEFHARLKEIEARDAWWRQARRMVREASIFVVAVGGALAALYSLVVFVTGLPW